MKLKYPYIADLIASFLTVCILILAILLGSGQNYIFRLIGLFCLICACITWIVSLLTLKKFGQIKDGNKYYETNVVVDSGIYALVRHPQYLAYMLFVAGFASLTQSWVIVILAFFSIILFYIHTLAEEKELELKYKGEYKNYCERIPRLNIIGGIMRRISSK